ncbi:YppG family protein [Halalkalibacter nanhaiisediminis]|uniref:YppG-like protein n=1 Tax=Halalkalibacter nanhaiisediminis TaxID=688079 RepID=A0A562QR68_9BACI|nr:YppG family protein [Halalkalibacter nanhaiisediminis]TWI59252.1 YppG-like protein [Halalkalibacter nanhaiisediminis]
MFPPRSQRPWAQHTNHYQNYPQPHNPMQYQYPTRPSQMSRYTHPEQQRMNIPPYQMGYRQKKPSMIKSAFIGENGTFDVGRTFQTVDRVMKTYNQVTPIVKQVTPFVKQVTSLFGRR